MGAESRSAALNKVNSNAQTDADEFMFIKRLTRSNSDFEIDSAPC